MMVRKPPMGFNTWNTFGNRIDEKLIMESADAMVSTGLKDAGYEYLVIDDCWSKYERDPESGKIVPDPLCAQPRTEIRHVFLQWSAHLCGLSGLV